MSMCVYIYIHIDIHKYHIHFFSGKDYKAPTFQNNVTLLNRLDMSMVSDILPGN